MRQTKRLVAWRWHYRLSCGEPASPLPVPQPPEQQPSPTPQFDAALGADSRCVPTTGQDFAHRPYAVPLSVADAELILVCTTRFAFGAMPPKRQGQAFNVLFEQPDAIARFQSVAVQGRTGRSVVRARGLAASCGRRGGPARTRPRSRETPSACEDSDVILGPRVASDLVPLVKSCQIGEEFRRDRDVIAAYYNKAG